MIETISTLVLTGLATLTKPAGTAWVASFGLPNSALARALVGLALALAIATAARRARALDWSGVAAAALCGTACSAAGWSWAITLVGYFVAASVVSRIGSARKERRTHSIVAKGGSRDATQVLANGGVYSAAAFASIVAPHPVWGWAGLGALAASSADTWATEIGLLAGRRPRDILKRTFVQEGMSGGVTGPGLAGALIGALVVATIGLLTGFSRGAALAAIVPGWLGALVDSLLGSSIQQRRRCDACAEDTELMTHQCGTPTRHIAGIRWVDNDVINLLATIVGLLLSAALYVTIDGSTPVHR